MMAHDYTQCGPTCLECQRLDTLAQQAGEATAEEAAYQADKVLHDAGQCPPYCSVCMEQESEPLPTVYNMAREGLKGQAVLLAEGCPPPLGTPSWDQGEWCVIQYHDGEYDYIRRLEARPLPTVNLREYPGLRCSWVGQEEDGTLANRYVYTYNGRYIGEVDCLFPHTTRHPNGEERQWHDTEWLLASHLAEIAVLKAESGE